MTWEPREEREGGGGEQEGGVGGRPGAGGRLGGLAKTPKCFCKINCLGRCQVNIGILHFLGM